MNPRLAVPSEKEVRLPAAVSNGTTLLFHRLAEPNGNVLDADGFEKLIRFLRTRFTFVSAGTAATKSAGKTASLTFDDGFRSDAEIAAPILRKYGVPALFFVCSRHLKQGEYLWFTYVQMLATLFRGKGFCAGGEWMDMSAAARPQTIKRLFETMINLRPHPSAIYKFIEMELPPVEQLGTPIERASYAGMSKEQVSELSRDPLFEIGAHTLDHPILTSCDAAETDRQIGENKNDLEEICGKPCTTMAYPFGIYDLDTVASCRRAGLQHGFAVTPKFNTSPAWEIPRVGIYSPSLRAAYIKTRFPGLFTETHWGKPLAFMRRLLHAPAPFRVPV